MKKLESLQFKDLTECAKLYVNVFNSEPWNDDWSVETATRRLEDIFYTPNFDGALYKEDGAIKGAIFGNYEQFYDGKHYIIKEMFIRNDLQGKGIGSFMLEQFEKELANQHVTTVILFTGRGNKTFTFYIKNGYEEFKGMAMMGKDL